MNGGMVERFVSEKDTRALRGFRIKDVRTLRQRPILSKSCHSELVSESR